MAASFGAETPILSYGPRAHADPGGRNDRVWVYWPAWAFRVVAPEFRDRSFNVLQKAVLGMLRASRLTAAELGGRLGVHPELAAFVSTELQEQGRLDANRTVTKRGVDLLEQESEESANLVPGWVFRDPWSGNLWPFVASSLEQARTVPGETGAGHPLLDLGTTGSPWRQRAWMQLPPDGRGADLPDAREILRAALRHERLGRRRQQVGVHLDGDVDGINAGGLDLKRLSGIEPEPAPVFLVSFLYMPRDGDERDGDWYACDFFGRGSDPALRRLVVRAAEEDEGGGLARRLDRLLGLTPHGDFDTFRRAVQGRKRKADRLLERALTIDVRRHAVAGPLADVIDGWLEIREPGDTARRRLGHVLTDCRRTLEKLFGEVSGEWPLAGVADRLPRNKEAKEELLRRTARDVGLAGLSSQLCGVPKYQVQAVSKYGDYWRLRPLVVATLLRARDDREHPLRSAARKAPDVLERIERVASLGGEAAHGGGDGRPDVDTVNAAVQETLEIVGLLLGLSIRPIEEVMPSGQEEQEQEQAKGNPQPDRRPSIPASVRPSEAARRLTGGGHRGSAQGGRERCN